MKPVKAKSLTAAFEKIVSAPGTERYDLRLYVAGMTPRSLRSITFVKELCEERLKGRYTLKVIDIYKQPGQVKKDQIIAAPTLVKKLPLPLRRIIGELADRETVLLALNLQPKR